MPGFIPINKNYRRLYDTALDKSSEYETYEDMLSYVNTNLTAYAGQILYCKETDSLYRIGKDNQGNKVLKRDINNVDIINDTTIAHDKTWSSSQIEDFIHANDDVIWNTVQGENLSIDYTKEGYLREVEIWGNTWQDEEDLSHIQHLGVYNKEKQGYEIEVESSNFYKKDLFYLGNNVSDLDLEATFIKPNDVRNSKFSIELKCGDFNDGDILFFDASHSLRLFKEGKYFKLENFNFDAGVVTKTFNCSKGDIISIVNDGSVKLYINGNFIENASYQVHCGNIRVVQEISFLKINTINIPQNYLLKSKPISHKTTLLLPCQLMKIGNISDRLYWDKNKGKYVVEKKINKTQLVSDKNFGNASEYQNHYICYYGRSKIPNLSNNGFLPGLQMISSIASGHGTNTVTDTVGVAWGNNDYRLLVNKSSVGNISEAREYFNSFSAYVYYPLLTPQLIETDIVKEILLPSYKDKTHLFVNGGLYGSIKTKLPINAGKAIKSLSERNTELAIENKEIKATNNIQDELIDTTMLVTDQMYMMLEPLLADILIDNEAINPLINMYVAMINRGLKTIDQIPIKWREQVEKIINESNERV